MSSAEVFSKFLGRPLDANEEDLLSRLSAQGIAKINRDVSSGISWASTLADLKIASEWAMLHRDSVQTHLSESAKVVIEQMNRAPTIDEMETLSALSPEQVAGLLCPRLEQGDVLEDLVDDLAADFKLQQLRAHSHAYADLHRIRIGVSHLVTTTLPPSDQKMRPHVTKPFGDSQKRVILGVNPARLWFVEDALAPILGCQVPETPSIHTALSVDLFEEDPIAFHKPGLNADVVEVFSMEDEDGDEGTLGPESPGRQETTDEDINPNHTNDTADGQPINSISPSPTQQRRRRLVTGPSCVSPHHVAGNAVQLRKLRPSVSFASASSFPSLTTSPIDECGPSPSDSTTSTTTPVKSPKAFRRCFSHIPNTPSILSCGTRLGQLALAWGKNPFKKIATNPKTTGSDMLNIHSHSPT